MGFSALFLTVAAGTPSLAARTTPPPKAKRWIVVYRDHAAQRRADGRRNHVPQKKFRLIPGETAALSDEQIVNLRRHPDVAYVEPDRPIHVLDNGRPVSALVDNVAGSQLSTTQATPYGVKMVGAPGLWPVTRGAGAVVAVLDTGIDMNQVDRGNIALTRSFIDGETVQDGHGHGTHTAGTVAAPDNGIGVVGVAPQATLLIGKVLSNDGSGTTSGLIEGIDWVVQNGAQIISMSLGADESSQAEKDACDRAAAAGALIIAAAGNDNTSRPSYPAAYPSVLSVAAIDASGGRASFSNYGPSVSVSAPGVGVLSTFPTGLGVSTEAEWGGSARPAAEMEGSATGVVTGAVVDCGIGNVGDFPASVRGQIAHIRRGTLTFSEKVANAKTAGAKGVILSNNVAGLFSGTLNGTTTLVVVAVSQADGNDLRARGTTTATVRQVATDYAALDGTSMATPHVSGVAALLVSAARPARLTPAQIRAALESSAEDLGTTGRDDYYGYGLVNVGRALQSLGFATVEDPVNVLRVTGGLAPARSGGPVGIVGAVRAARRAAGN